MLPMKRPLVFEYIDYRAFLKDLYNFRKQKDRYFSYRYFANKAGFSSPNFLKLVMDGQRNLAHTGLLKIAKGFGLNTQERDYFENLVFMNQSADHEERNHFYRKMMAVKGFKKIHKLAKENYEYFSKWYYPAVREILTWGSRNITSEQVATLLHPRITVTEAEGAIALLLKLNLIKKNSDGLWEQVNPDITTGPEIKSLVVANFHREMIKLAAESIDRFPAKQRDISALTLSIDRKNLPEIKSRLVAFRKELMVFNECNEDPDRVVQINIQFFPLTK